jgi:serine/threonine protein kinase
MSSTAAQVPPVPLEKKSSRKDHKKEKKDKHKKEKKKSARGPSREKSGLSNASKLKSGSAEAEYTLGTQIGGISMGGEFFTAIKEGTAKSDGRAVLVKTVKKPSQADKVDAVLRKEIQKAATLSHPHIARIVDAFEDSEYFYIVTENFKERLVLKKAYPEAEVKNIIRQLVEALTYLHSQGIAANKLELKPEKLYWDGKTLHLDDFGMNQAVYPTEDKLRSIGASSKGLYVAPEVLTALDDTAEFGTSPDSWALGVILYYLLAGYPAFVADTEPALYKKIIALDYKLNIEPWDKISDGAKALVNNLLVKDPAKRFTIEQIKSDPWLQ